MALWGMAYDEGKLLGREDLDLLAEELISGRQREALRRVVADQALALGGSQRRAQRHRGVGDGAVAEALALRLLVGQPVHEPGQRVGRDVDQLEAGREVGMGEGADQAAVFVAGVLTEAAAALAAVALDPLVQITAEGDRRALLQLAAVAVGLALALDPLGLLVAAGVALSLSPAGAEDADVADRPALAVDALEDARRLRLSQPPIIAAAWTALAGRRTLGNAHEHHLVSRGRVVCAAPPHLTFADKTLTGPIGMTGARPQGARRARRRKPGRA